ncbi:MAG: hypothetical protein BZY67_03445, partial [SAR202 cluster bacterium Io17-Chloro-G1]
MMETPECSPKVLGTSNSIMFIPNNIGSYRRINLTIAAERSQQQKEDQSMWQKLKGTKLLVGIVLASMVVVGIACSSADEP